MLDQIYRITKITGERVSNVVVMGTGEPLDNYDSLLASSYVSFTPATRLYSKVILLPVVSK